MPRMFYGHRNDLKPVKVSQKNELEFYAKDNDCYEFLMDKKGKEYDAIKLDDDRYLIFNFVESAENVEDSIYEIHMIERGIESVDTSFYAGHEDGMWSLKEILYYIDDYGKNIERKNLPETLELIGIDRVPKVSIVDNEKKKDKEIKREEINVLYALNPKTDEIYRMEYDYKTDTYKIKKMDVSREFLEENIIFTPSNHMEINSQDGFKGKMILGRITGTDYLTTIDLKEDYFERTLFDENFQKEEAVTILTNETKELYEPYLIMEEYKQRQQIKQTMSPKDRMEEALFHTVVKYEIVEPMEEAKKRYDAETKGFKDNYYGSYQEILDKKYEEDSLKETNKENAEEKDTEKTYNLPVYDKENEIKIELETNNGLEL